MFRRDGVPTMMVTVRLPGPKVKEVEVSGSGDIVIKFDQKVGELEQSSCDRVFDEATLKLLGELKCLY